ncbi:MAG: nucleotidyltransferase family protein [Acidobacteria bacterium]|nr:nucleotidyltransferase family protein [Acidobacteriota bacterium]MBV9071813.1 nucleotidyltransferase family protein [Acidobacteriota bacterium]MBV9187297.1 nucleotidyltransferase family protein [Acidobacteriota bacterium]
MADVPDALPIPASLRDPLRALLRGESADWPSAATAEDAAQLVESIKQNGLGPLVYARPSDWPIRSLLRDIAIHAAAGESSRLADVREVLGAFETNGIRVLIIKGTGLAYDIYPSPELRPRGDTDLLIAKSDLEKVRRILHGRGYASSITSGDTLAIRQQSFARAGHVYDVHWDVANSPVVRDALPFEELLSRAIAVPRIAPNALAPSHVDALVLACIHRVAHHHDTERLIWLYDIHLLREAMSADEHARFWRLAAERGVVAICERSIELADEWFAAAPHDRARDWLTEDERSRDEPSAAFLNRDRRRGAVLSDDFKALDWRSRFRRLRELALPPLGFMRQSFPSAPAAVLPALYVWRGARGVLRLMRRVR